MLVKALVTFGGQYAMYRDEIADVPVGPVADVLIANGYIVPVADTAPAEEAEAPIEVQDEEFVEKTEEKVLVDLERMTKAELLDFAEKNGIEVNTKAKKADLTEQIMDALDEE